MNVNEFINRIKTIKPNYRDVNLEVYSYNSQTKKCANFPMSEDYVLAKALQSNNNNNNNNNNNSAHQDLEVLIKKKYHKVTDNKSYKTNNNNTYTYIYHNPNTKRSTSLLSKMKELMPDIGYSEKRSVSQTSVNNLNNNNNNNNNMNNNKISNTSSKQFQLNKKT